MVDFNIESSQFERTTKEFGLKEVGYVVLISVFFGVFFCACRENGTVKFLTKGDNNSVDDRGLYAPGQLWLTKNDIVGRARGVLPYVGMITIYMNEYPNFKVSKQSQRWMTYSKRME